MSDNRYRVVLTKQAKKDLKNIRHDLDRALKAIARLETDALPGHTLKNDFGDCRSLEFNLKGSGAYRAVYIVDETLV
ncbi:MAG: type II toxin-antitoxin system RelE family toxin, partial [Thermomicrobiales bacterium]